MNIYDIHSPAEVIAGNPYPGRGIIIGKTPDGTRALTAGSLRRRTAKSLPSPSTPPGWRIPP